MSIFSMNKQAKETTEKAIEIVKLTYPDIQALSEHFHKSTWRVAFFSPKLSRRTNNIKIRHVYHPHDIAVDELVGMINNEIDKMVLESL
jgi:hypothetical protein